MERSAIRGCGATGEAVPGFRFRFIQATRRSGKLTAGRSARLAAKCGRRREKIAATRGKPVASSADLAHLRTLEPTAVSAATPSWFAGRQTAWIAGALIVILCALVLPPAIYLLQGSFALPGPINA